MLSLRGPQICSVAKTRVTSLSWSFGEDGKKIGEQNEPKRTKVKNSESEAIEAARRSLVHKLFLKAYPPIGLNKSVDEVVRPVKKLHFLFLQKLLIKQLGAES